jgi:hypothetical protein
VKSGGRAAGPGPQRGRSTPDHSRRSGRPGTAHLGAE